MTQADLRDTDTWTLYTDGLCQGCRGLCCHLSVEVTVDDLLRLEVIEPIDAQLSLQKIARKLRLQGVISGFSPTRAVFTLAKAPTGDCIFQDPQSRGCTLYAKRPETCRAFPQIGARLGHCPYQGS